MSVILVVKIEGREFIPNTFNMRFSREVSDLTALPTSAILGGILDLSFVLEMESNDDTFLAAWFQESGKTHTVDVDLFHLANNEKFLTMKLENAQCVVYVISINASADLGTVTENAVLEIQIASPKISIGQATIEPGH